MSLSKMNAMKGKCCNCGRLHDYDIRIETGKGAIEKLPEVVRNLGGSYAYMLCDKNTYAAAGMQAEKLLQQTGITVLCHCYCDEEVLEPDEKNVGSAVMHFDKNCDIIVCAGSGVLNDIGKIVSNIMGKPYVIVATAPSMDGYASASSSMTRDGLKISLPSRNPDAIVGDTEILCQAPLKMMKAGLGDMIAKYVSICEWRIAHLITGEYYCEEVAQLIRGAVKTCVYNASGLLKRDPVAVQAVFEGLVIGGIAMNYAGVSRPASGVEHYISHVLDMRGVEYHIPVEFHGIQCAVGTLIAVKLYEKLARITPDREKALNYAKQFDYGVWANTLGELLGKGAESMIALETKEKKYDVQLHEKRLEIILQNWDAIIQIIRRELPMSQELEQLLDAIDMPKSLTEIGASEEMLPTIFRATKDIRDKYVLSRLCWDLGVIEEMI